MSEKSQVLGSGRVGRITLVCTMHRERGLCSEHELLKILETIGPDVFFEEIRQSDFDSHYRDRSRSTLETRTVSRYLKVKSAQQVPVDDYVIPESFLRDMGILSDYVESRSAEYRAVEAKIHQMALDLGFRYLNSPEFMAHRKYADELFEEVITMSGSDELRKLLSTWNDQLRRREDSMMENIYDFCRKSSFTEGVFLVGAGHMSSIVQDIEGRMQKETNLVDWKFWSRL